MKEKKFYTCKYDRPFKEIFLKEQNKDILKALLEQVLELKINKIDIKNIERNTGNIKIRRKYLDALLYTDQGKIGIEINSENKDYVKPRNMAFLCDMYASHTLVGQAYTEETKIIQINFSYGLKDDKGTRIYKIQDKENKEFVKNLFIYEINMEYYLKLWYNKNELEVNKYKYFIMLNLKKEDLKEISKEDKVVSKYMEELVKLNSNPEFREYMSVEEDERKIHNSLLQSSYNSGIKEGKIEGIKEGKIEGIREGTIILAKKLLKENIDINIISKTTELSIDELNELKND